MVCSTTTTGPRNRHDNGPQSIIPQPVACVWPAIHFGNKFSHGWRPTLTRLSTWWIKILIHSIRQFYPTDPWSSHVVSRRSVGAVSDDAWLAEAHKWDVCCVVPYPTVSAKLFVRKQLCLVMSCIDQTAETLSGTDYDSRSRTATNILFSLVTRWQPTP